MRYQGGKKTLGGEYNPCTCIISRSSTLNALILISEAILLFFFCVFAAKPLSCTSHSVLVQPHIFYFCVLLFSIYYHIVSFVAGLKLFKSLQLLAFSFRPQRTSVMLSSDYNTLSGWPLCQLRSMVPKLESTQMDWKCFGNHWIIVVLLDLANKRWRSFTSCMTCEEMRCQSQTSGIRSRDSQILCSGIHSC